MKLFVFSLNILGTITLPLALLKSPSYYYQIGNEKLVISRNNIFNNIEEKLISKSEEKIEIKPTPTPATKQEIKQTPTPIPTPKSTPVVNTPTPSPSPIHVPTVAPTPRATVQITAIPKETIEPTRTSYQTTSTSQVKTPQATTVSTKSSTQIPTSSKSTISKAPTATTKQTTIPTQIPTTVKQTIPPTTTIFPTSIPSTPKPTNTPTQVPTTVPTTPKPSNKPTQIPTISTSAQTPTKSIPTEAPSTPKPTAPQSKVSTPVPKPNEEISTSKQNRRKELDISLPSSDPSSMTKLKSLMSKLNSMRRSEEAALLKESIEFYDFYHEFSPEIQKNGIVYKAAKSPKCVRKISIAPSASGIKKFSVYVKHGNAKAYVISEGKLPQNHEFVEDFVLPEVVCGSQFVFQADQAIQKNNLPKIGFYGPELNKK